MKARRTILSFWIIIVGLFGLLWSQDPKSELFKEADLAKAKAIENRVNLFSPGFWETAEQAYAKAEDGFRKGKNLEDIKRDIKVAVAYYLKAVENTRMVQKEVADCIRAREDALKVDAPVYRPQAWADAEAEFRRVMMTFEQNDPLGAKNRARKAERTYRQIELEAIKAKFLDKTRRLLGEAERAGVRKRAPKTLSRCESLVAEAEKLLNENRYDTDQVRELSRQAYYEALHASYLAQAIKSFEDTKTPLEDILLEHEAHIRKIADRLDVNPLFDQGPTPVVDRILQGIWTLQQTLSHLEQDVADRDAQIAALNEEITRLREQVGELKDKEETLSKWMEAQKLQREKYDRIERLFGQEEAQVLRVGNRVILRLTGLSFPVGKAVIEPKYFTLLTKVLQAFEEYPGARITVEGHTDAYGTDEANLKLSFERAEAVKQYLVATSGMDAARIEAIGYGESRPIASNETEEGRRRNRRIDIVIDPETP